MTFFLLDNWMPSNETQDDGEAEEIQEIADRLRRLLTRDLAAQLASSSRVLRLIN
jgi:hypothetical protein